LVDSVIKKRIVILCRKNKAVEPDGILLETWKILWHFGSLVGRFFKQKVDTVTDSRTEENVFFGILFKRKIYKNVETKVNE